MKFYELTHPNYETDQQKSCQNPVSVREELAIPSVICPDCGIWSGSDKLRFSLPPSAYQESFKIPSILPLNEWSRNRPIWAGMLGVDASMIRPGTLLGSPTGRLQAGAGLPDFLHPTPGLIWVKLHVMNAFVSSALRGISFAQVHFESCEDCKHRDDLTELWEIVASGKARRKGTDPAASIACDICGRRTFPAPGDLRVDEATWDESDFFNVDLNPNIVLVTERVKDLIEEERFSNVALIPVE